MKKSHYSTSKVASYSVLPTARVMTTEINANEKQRLHENVVTWKEQQAVLDDEITSRQQEKVVLEEDRQTVEDQVRDIKARVEYRKNLLHRLENAKKQLSALEKERKDLNNLKEATDMAILVRILLKTTSF